MTAPFHTTFDTETCGGARTRPGEYRTPFQVDRDRIVNLPAFRRLQSKTQVFLPGEYDFYRTRLTHSLEVAQLGRSICQWLRVRTPEFRDNGGPDTDLVEAVCLAHDLGHPPFGHIGERALHELLRGHGGFEGNAQTLRLLTDLAYERPDGARGMKPTRALLDGVLKYKRLLREHPAVPDNHFLYDDQEPVRAFVLGGAAPADNVRSLECQIMDWADDAAYSLNDIVDGAGVGFISVERVEAWAERRATPLTSLEKSWMAELFHNLKAGSLEQAFARRTGEFVRACAVVPCDGPLAAVTQRHAWRLVIDPEAEAQTTFFKRLAVDLIFRSTQIQQIEFKGRHILRRLFEAIAETSGGRSPALGIVPVPVARRIAAAPDEAGRYRAIADYLAAMTDALALRMYKRLFDPDFRSLTELV